MQFLHNLITSMSSISSVFFNHQMINPNHIFQIIQYITTIPNQKPDKHKDKPKFLNQGKWASPLILTPKDTIKQPPYSPFLSIPFVSNKPDTKSPQNPHKTTKGIQFVFLFFVAELREKKNKIKLVDIHGCEGKKSWDNSGKIDGSDMFGSWEKQRKIEVQRSVIKAEGLWVGVASSVIVLLEILPGFSLSGMI